MDTQLCGPCSPQSKQSLPTPPSPLHPSPPDRPHASTGRQQPAAHLLLGPGRLQADTKGLVPLVARRAGQAVVAGVGVDAAMGLAGCEAHVRDHGALWDQQAGREPRPRPPRATPRPGEGTHLVQILAVGAVAQEAHGAGTTGPGAVGEAAALGSREAGVGQAAVCRERGGGEACSHPPAAPRPGAAPSSVLRDAYSPTAGARRPRGGGPRSHPAHPPAGRLHTPTCREAPHSAHPPIGQLFLLHIWCSLTSPTQSLPPCWGSGLLQTRVRSRIPPAQVTVQADHGDQGLHRPSTGGGRTARSCRDGTCTGTRPGLQAECQPDKGFPAPARTISTHPGRAGPGRSWSRGHSPCSSGPPSVAPASCRGGCG